MSAFDEYRTALSQSQQLYQANDHGCEREKRARAQAPKGWIPAGMGTGAGAAQMSSEVPAMVQAKPHSSVHMAVSHSPQQEAWRNQVATAAFFAVTPNSHQAPWDGAQKSISIHSRNIR